jgi:release factor glutamine methyltransferase
MPSHQSRVTNHQSLRALLAEGIAQLDRAQIPSAALAAELLLMHALQRDRAWIYAHSENEPGTAACEHYLALISRRTGGVPTQHLTGHQEFWGLEFEVTPEVLIPRPETEHLIEVALDQLGLSDGVDSPRRHEKFQIVDVGTGSGCIAVALAHELPVAQFIATDISGAALKVASRNAERHGVAQRIDFIECDLLEFSEHR